MAFGGTDESTDNVLAAARMMLAGSRPELISDQVSRPTYTRDLAAAIVRLLAAAEPPTGVVHITNAGQASWYEVGLVMARELRRRTGEEVADPEPVPMTRYGFLGPRPRSSVLGSSARQLGCSLPHWSDAIRRYCAELLGEPTPGSSVMHGNSRPVPL